MDSHHGPKHNRDDCLVAERQTAYSLNRLTAVVNELCRLIDSRPSDMIEQMLAHLTCGGAPLRTGDLFASGTVSGPGRGQLGCLLELTRDGAEPITLADGSQRAFLEDGDEVAIAATAPGPGGESIGFGAVSGRVIPAA